MEGDDGRMWQPYSDELIYHALITLPFGGPELAGAVGPQLEALMGAVGEYMEKRPRRVQPGLRPFSDEIKEGDAAAGCVRGSAFLCMWKWRG
jgi:hypothetical protein